jgi:hypothetical protein
MTEKQGDLCRRGGSMPPNLLSRSNVVVPRMTNLEINHVSEWNLARSEALKECREASPRQRTFYAVGNAIINHVIHEPQLRVARS